jgi:hypothetical protein
MPIKNEDFKPGEVYYLASDGGVLIRLPLVTHLTCLRAGKRDVFFQTGVGKELRYTRQECARFTFLTEEEVQTLNILREMLRIINDRSFLDIDRISPQYPPSREVVMKIHNCVYALQDALRPLQGNR